MSDAIIAWGNEVAAGCYVLECTWHDQGWGNRKGMIFARNPGGAWRALAPSVAPHESTRLSVEIPPELRGERVQFGYRVGGGGGHSLSITAAAIRPGGGVSATAASTTVERAEAPPRVAASMAATAAVPDIHARDFCGFGTPLRTGGSAAAASQPAALPTHLRGTMEVETVYNSRCDLVVDAGRLVWKDVHVVASEIHMSAAPRRQGGAECMRLRFTVFVPNQRTEWLRGVVGVIESFDISFAPDGASFDGTFRRQGEGILRTRGTRKETLEQRVARLPSLVRSKSADPESHCPICLSEWDEEGVLQTQTECGHSFCMRCVVSTCNMTPPNTVGSCALCRAQVTLEGLKRVHRKKHGEREVETV